MGLIGLACFALMFFLIARVLWKANKAKKFLKAYCAQQGYSFEYDLRGFKVKGKTGAHDFEFGNWPRITTHRTKDRKMDFYIPELKLAGEKIQISDPLPSKGFLATLGNWLNDKRVLLNLGEEDLLSVYSNDETRAKTLVNNEIISLYRSWFNRFPYKKYGRFQKFPSLRWSDQGLEILYFQERRLQEDELRQFLELCFSLTAQLTSTKLSIP